MTLVPFGLIQLTFIYYRLVDRDGTRYKYQLFLFSMYKQNVQAKPFSCHYFEQKKKKTMLYLHVWGDKNWNSFSVTYEPRANTIMEQQTDRKKESKHAGKMQDKLLQLNEIH